jgi:hypothetical protein
VQPLSALDQGQVPSQDRLLVHFHLSVVSPRLKLASMLAVNDVQVGEITPAFLLLSFLQNITGESGKHLERVMY